MTGPTAARSTAPWSTLEVQRIHVPMADVGPPSTLPDVGAGLVTPYQPDSSDASHPAAGPDYGTLPNVFPYLHQSDYSRALTDRVLAAVVLETDQYLLEESCRAHLAAGQPGWVVHALDRPSLGPVRRGRLQLLLAQALAAAGSGEQPRLLLSAEELPDLREGETALSDLWDQLFPGQPVPPDLDFRMH